MTTFLIWSNEAGAWWGPNGNGYRGSDIWAAGRFDEADARRRCGIRTWRPRTVPPEVMVPAPENGKDALTLAEIQAAPDVARQHIDRVSREARADRDAECASCPWCRSGGEPGTKCRCSFRCGYGGCCSTALYALNLISAGV
jgi:hypothetical protein